MTCARVWITRIVGVDPQYDMHARFAAERLRALMFAWLPMANNTPPLRLAGLMIDDADTTLLTIGSENSGFQPEIRIDVVLPDQFQPGLEALNDVLNDLLAKWLKSHQGREHGRLITRGKDAPDICLIVTT